MAESRSLGARSAVCLLLLLALVLNAAYLFGGFQGEDYMFLGVLREDPLPVPRLKGLWATTDYPALTSIWWFEGQGVTPFWRPIPSLLIEGSVRLFGESAFPLHFLAVALHGLVAGMLFLLVRALTGRPLVAFLAGLAFLATEDHSMVVGWVAAITDILCAFFVCLALLAHARWLSTRRVPALLTSLAALVAALLSKESAAVVPVAIVLMTALLPEGRDGPRPTFRAGLASLRTSLSWVPAAAILAAYLVVYRLAGFGGFTTGLYVDPFVDPGGYFAHLLGHLPVMWLATSSPIPPSIPMFLPAALPVLAVLGALVFLLLGAALRFALRQGLAVFAAALYLLCLLPQMAADASERALYLPTLGSSILLALLLARAGPIARRFAPDAARPERLTRIGAGVVLWVTLVPGILLSAAMPFLYLHAFEKPGRQAATAVPHVEEADPEHVLVLNAPGPLHTFYLHPNLAFRCDPDLDLRVLSAMCGVTTVVRESDRSFTLRVDRKGWLTNVFSGAIRAPHRLRAGRTYDRGFLKATLAELTSDRRDVLAVRFDLELALGDSKLLLLVWDGGAFVPLDLAREPVGRPVTLSDTTDRWGGMW